MPCSPETKENALGLVHYAPGCWDCGHSEPGLQKHLVASQLKGQKEPFVAVVICDLEVVLVAGSVNLSSSE